VPVVDLIATQTQDPFKVLVATILSARTKDEVTAAACRRLFQQVRTVDDLAQLSQQELEKIIYPVGFFRNKAGYLQKLPTVLYELYNGRVPDEVEALVKLPGVGRKTANLVVAVAFDKPAICVDTHVHRIMNIWGYVQTETPLQTEMALRDILPPHYWTKINAILVAFGQGTCRPVRPHCDRCVIAMHCPQIGVTPRQRPQERKKDKGIKMVSWNVNGLRAVHKKGFIDAVHRLDPDILALQEIKAHPDQLPNELHNLEGYTAYWWPARKKGYSGTAVYTRVKPVDVRYGLGREGFDNEGRVMCLEFETFFMVNVYFPNAQAELKRIDFKVEFNRCLQSFVEELAWKKSVVVCGDFNVAHREIDLANPKANEGNPGFSEPEREWIDQLFAGGFVDTFRRFCQEPGYYTWWSYRSGARAKNIGWRIDYFVVDPASAQRVQGATIHDDILGSDHCPISLELL
jgi:exodeoxyribonuclease-3